MIDLCGICHRPEDHHTSNGKYLLDNPVMDHGFIHDASVEERVEGETCNGVTPPHDECAGGECAPPGEGRIKRDQDIVDGCRDVRRPHDHNRCRRTAPEPSPVDACYCASPETCINRTPGAHAAPSPDLREAAKVAEEIADRAISSRDDGEPLTHSDIEEAAYAILSRHFGRKE